MRYLADTDIVSYFIAGRYAALNAKMQAALESNDVAISVMTRAELRYGLAHKPLALHRSRAIEVFLSKTPCLDWTAAAADVYGSLRAELERAGSPIGSLDTQIAAHALVLGLILVTNNQKHFKRITELRTENWVS